MTMDETTAVAPLLKALHVAATSIATHREEREASRTSTIAKSRAVARVAASTSRDVAGAIRHDPSRIQDHAGGAETLRRGAPRAGRREAPTTRPCQARHKTLQTSAATLGPGKLSSSRTDLERAGVTYTRRRVASGSAESISTGPQVRSCSGASPMERSTTAGAEETRLGRARHPLDIDRRENQD